MGMQKWQWTSLILSTFGFFKELRPSEPFITEYIIDFKNVTASEVIHIAFPVSTYSSLLALSLVFLVTDWLRYRPIVILEALVYIFTWTILIFGQDLTAIILVETLYGIACSTEVAYYTYIYAQVDKDHYKKVTSHTSSALYAGKFMGGALAQLFVSYKLMNYHELTWLTLGFSIIGFLATLLLPKVKNSIYFHRLKDPENECAFVTENNTKPAYIILWDDFKQAYSKSYILKWSIWWALASAGQYQVVNYVQSLWETINEERSLESYNGVVKALHTFLSAVLCLGIGYMKVKWRKWGESLLSVISLIQGGMLLWMAKSNHLYTSYLCYTIFRTVHPVMLTIASAEVAQGISKNSHGLIFGMNIFFALVLQTILTLVVSDRKGFAFDVQQQFLIYGAYFVVLGTLFLFMACWSSSSNCLKGRRRNRANCDTNSCNHNHVNNVICHAALHNQSSEHAEILLQTPTKTT